MKKKLTTQQLNLSKRAKLIKFLKSEGYSGEQIGQIFSINRSTVSRVLNDEESYKKWVKQYLRRL